MVTHKIQSFGRKVLRNYGMAIIIAGTLAISGAAWAAASIVVTPSTNLTNGQKISVSGSGLAKNSTGAIVECNSDPNQPTIMVAGNPVPVSCTNPLSDLTTTSKTGLLAATSFTVKTGTVGPPATGTDSSKGNAATDAANYPCPPTAAQIAAGDTCTISFGDANGDDVAKNITFAGQTSTTPTTTTPTTTTGTKTTTTLVNTGPGDSIGIFILVVVVGSTAHYLYRSHKHSKSL